MGTKFTGEIEENAVRRTESAQLSGDSTRKVKFPHTVCFRSLTAKIYGKTKSYPFYRLAVRVAGKRLVRSFQTYSEAKTEAETKLREMAQGNQSAGLNAREAADALAIREAVQAFYRDTGRKVSALEAVTGYLATLRALPPNVSPEEACRIYRQTIAAVQRTPLAKAVTEFCDARQPKAVAKDGKRPVLNPVYVADTKRHLEAFSTAFAAHDVCDLTKQHLDLFMESQGELSPKSRNHVRATLRMFFGWCVRRDYLPANHRLLEADGLRKEDADTGEVEYYTVPELRSLLDNATEELRIIIALQAFGGLRLQEALRLNWRDVWRVPGNIEISSAKAKTRARRLVEINSTLAGWLESNRDSEGAVAGLTLDAYTWQLIQLRKRLEIPSRKNGLRHGFLSAHFALHQNEGKTAAQAGTSPAMLFKHYRGLMAKTDAEKWFNVLPVNKATNPTKP